MRHLPRSASPSLAGLALVLGAAAVTLAACGGIEKARPRPRSARASFTLEVPRIMRGTVASETIILGYNPVIVRGYGLVVGLQGTGSSAAMPPALRAHMLSEMVKHGIGQASAGLEEIDPAKMLDSPDTAVVVVEGVIPPGSVARRLSLTHHRLGGTHFDVRVYVHPYTDAVSLEGGRLYTTDLRPVLPGEILPRTGSRQSAGLAEASGPIFVNPFAAPRADSSRPVNRTVGRIMNGGVVTRDLPLKLRIATASHTRAEIIQSAINARFPQETGQDDLTAHGESDEAIRITVPTSYRDRPDQFIELLRHTSIRMSNVEAIATSIRRVVTDDPSYAFDATWRWQALGARALPIIQELYDYPEEQPRVAALRAGAKLDDPQATPYLIEMTRSGSAEARRRAVDLLGEMPLDPRIDEALRRLLDDEDVDVRLAAYEAATKRLDPFISRTRVGDRFVLDIIDSTHPMIYVTQIGRPRIALFGRDLSLDRPLLVDAWSGRLMLKGAPRADTVDVYYEPEHGGDRVILSTSPRLDQFIRFLGQQTTVEQPEPGLGLSYGQTVAALYAIWRDKYLPADFKSQQDRVLAAIIRRQSEPVMGERPEFSDPDFDFLRPGEAEPGSTPATPDATGGLGTMPAPPPLEGASSAARGPRGPS